MNSFLLPFRRFISCRGLPATLISDNTKTFKGSATEVAKIARLKDVLRYFANNGVHWKFIIEKAPWWGGFWEHLIQSVKRCLRKYIGRTTLSYDELNTLLIEVESVINSRPLTYVEDDTDGINYTLCPSHLINGQRVMNTPNNAHFKVVSTNASITPRGKQHHWLLQHFTSQWRKSYLLTLRKRHAQVSRDRHGADVAFGYVVILRSGSTNRMLLKLAEVKGLPMGNDGNCRAAIIKVPDSSGKPHLMKCSERHLFPLELNTNTTSQTDWVEETEAVPNCTTPAAKPWRDTTIRAELLQRFRSLKQILIYFRLFTDMTQTGAVCRETLSLQGSTYSFFIIMLDTSVSVPS